MCSGTIDPTSRPTIGKYDNFRPWPWQSEISKPDFSSVKENGPQIQYWPITSRTGKQLKRLLPSGILKTWMLYFWITAKCAVDFLSASQSKVFAHTTLRRPLRISVRLIGKLKGDHECAMCSARFMTDTKNDTNRRGLALGSSACVSSSRFDG